MGNSQSSAGSPKPTTNSCCPSCFLRPNCPLHPFHSSSLPGLSSNESGSLPSPCFQGMLATLESGVRAAGQPFPSYYLPGTVRPELPSVQDSCPAAFGLLGMRSRQVSKTSSLLIGEKCQGENSQQRRGIGGWLGRVLIRCGCHGNIDGWGFRGGTAVGAVQVDGLGAQTLLPEQESYVCSRQVIGLPSGRTGSVGR